MKFKSLTVQGFKSFVDKTVIEFPGGITCVIGPNGSGKSNILDAIRWIFGEQSAKELRGADMDDVIFAGSQHRKASGFAEVSLTLSELPENLTSKWGSFSEITVTRKHYRSGERDYLINGKKCRLKDIREIFYDSGLGTKSISIIEQGKVDKIIQSTPEDLRAFFEETAGVMRFKEGKKDAERRLNQTKDNLSRVTDILAEIRGQLETLTLQAEKVRRYRDLAKRQSSLQKAIIYHRYQKTFEELSEVLNTINTLKINLSGHTERFTKLTAAETQLRQKTAELRKNFNEKNDAIIKAEAESGRAEADIRLLENEIEAAEKSKETLHSDISFLQKKLAELTDRRTGILESKVNQTDKITALQEKIEEIEERISDYETMREDIKEELFAADDEYLKTAHRASETRNAIFQNETMLTRYEKDKERLAQEKEESIRDTQFTENNIIVTEQEINRLQTEIETIDDTLDTYKEKYSELKDELNILENKANEKKLEINSAKSKLNMLNNRLKTETSGQDNSALMEKFGGWLLLEKLTPALVREYGDLVVFPSSKRDAVMEGVSSVKHTVRFVFDGDVQELLKSADQSVKEYGAVIANGLVYRKPGADDKREAVVKLQAEIKQCTIEIEDAETALEGISEQIPDVSDNLETISDKLEELQQMKQTATLDIKDKERSIADIKQKHERMTKRAAIIDSEIANIGNEIKRCEEKIELYTKQNKDLSAQMAEAEQRKEELNSKLEDIDAMYEDVRDEHSAYKVELRGVQESINGFVRELGFIDKDISESTVKLNAAKNRLSQLLTSDIVNLKDRLDAKRSEFQDIIKKRHLLNEEKFRLDTDIAETEKQMEETGKQIDKYNLEIRGIEDDIFDAEKKKERFESDISNLREAFDEKFQMNVKDFDMDMEDFQPTKAKTELSGIEREIDELGPLNMTAETEYNEIQERNEFLTAQKTDLEEAVASIHNLIREMDENTTQIFSETFEGVKKNFERVFAILFGQGTCDLTLTTPDDVLNSGVEIFIQPPGKRLQNMNLMSGGEKAMGACTLLFALFLYRPTPFCFLDEIDAPLDENNIDRFLRMVHTLSADTQFVIITHNQKTMAEADSIYGVTMQEPGVSRILSVVL